MDSAVTFHLERFDGPLELLLHLISKNRVDITDIPVALILDQYLEYLDRMRAMDMEIASSFIVMAAQLIYIKTRILLPRAQEDTTEDPRTELVEALLAYRRFKQAAAVFSVLTESGFSRIVKSPSPLPELPLEYHNRPEDLLRALRLIRERSRRALRPRPQDFAGLVGAEPIPVERKIASILKLLLRNTRVSLEDIYRTATSRAELIALFLAVLELLNDRRAELPGDELVLKSPVRASDTPNQNEPAPGEPIRSPQDIQ